MLADFYISGLSNDMKIAVQENHLVGQILYRSLVPSEKNGVSRFLTKVDEVKSSRKFTPKYLQKLR